MAHVPVHRWGKSRYLKIRRFPPKARTGPNGGNTRRTLRRTLIARLRRQWRNRDLARRASWRTSGGRQVVAIATKWQEGCGSAHGPIRRRGLWTRELAAAYDSNAVAHCILTRYQDSVRRRWQERRAHPAASGRPAGHACVAWPGARLCRRASGCAGVASRCGARGCPGSRGLVGRRIKPDRSMRPRVTSRPSFVRAGTLAAVRRGLVPAALSFCEQFAVFEVTVQRFGAKTTQCSQDLSHFFDDCTHDFLFARVSA